MVRRGRRVRGALFDRARGEINVTPLVDVMLVLLVVFMVTAPMLATGFRVDLPRSRSAMPLPPRPAVMVVLGADGRVMVDGEEAALDRVVDTIEAHLGDDRTRPIRLRADGSAPYRHVVAVLDGLAARGLREVGLATFSAPPPWAGSAEGDVGP